MDLSLFQETPPENPSVVVCELREERFALFGYHHHHSFLFSVLIFDCMTATDSVTCVQLSSPFKDILSLKKTLNVELLFRPLIS